MPRWEKYTRGLPKCPKMAVTEIDHLHEYAYRCQNAPFHFPFEWGILASVCIFMQVAYLCHSHFGASWQPSRTIIILRIFIFRSREKEELINRLAKNPETSNVFKTTTNIRKFSTTSLRGDLPLGIMDSQPRTSTRVSQSLNNGILPPQVRSSIISGRSSRGSQMSSRGSLLANRSSSSYPPDLNESRGTIEDTVKLRIVTKTTTKLI